MATKSNGVEEEDYYDMLGVEIDADLTAIKKTYRKMALKHHPDRGGDAKLFHRINRAYEFLADPKKREEYDKKLRAELQKKKRQMERDDQFNAKRKKMKEDLIKKETKYDATSQESAREQSRMKDKVTRLREEGLARQREQEDKRNKKLQEKTDKLSQKINSMKKDEPLESATVSGRTIRIKWNKKQHSHSDNTIAIIFRKYGQIDLIKLSEKGNSAKIVFQQPRAAVDAVREQSQDVDSWREIGLVGHHMVPGIYDDDDMHAGRSESSNSIPAPTGPDPTDKDVVNFSKLPLIPNHIEYEAHVLNKLMEKARELNQIPQ